jgi:hypothetical protein
MTEPPTLTPKQRGDLLRAIDRLRDWVSTGKIYGITLLVNRKTGVSYNLVGFWSHGVLLELCANLLSDARLVDTALVDKKMLH